MSMISRDKSVAVRMLGRTQAPGEQVVASVSEFFLKRVLCKNKGFLLHVDPV